MENLKSCGAVIFFKGKKIEFLVLQYGLGHWDFPRGLMEKDEDEQETALREIKEETEITDIKLNEKFKERTHFFFKNKTNLVKKEVIYFLAKTKSKDVKISSEHLDYKWLNYEDALKQLTFKNTKEVLKKADKFLKSLI